MQYTDVNGKVGTRMMKGASERTYGNLAILADHGNTDFLSDGITELPDPVIPPPTLAEIKTAKKTKLDGVAVAVTCAGVIVNIGGENIWYDTTPYSLNMVNGAATQYLMNGKLPPFWKGRDPNDHSIKKRPVVTADELKLIADTISVYVEDVYVQLDTLKSQVDAAVNEASVSAVEWPQVDPDES